ncbi:hypothetical protein K458DRAFT_434075 [Lentithecium fluviatile CBS 122367]|uniref:Glucose-methanol-choline oxidoreductase N-terminal domain-containing protein n=1 Tax=Lentithecium fluviatile CBS 122367 TaxID=1168545 RepID=A0A6G1IS76_9PLEO|nr:hypothetical protein K458DRAFT_434075 [Lentithecium fluviatile CBS 122367]
MTRSFLVSCALLVLRVSAQTASPYTDAKSGITFDGYSHASGYTFGIALPENPTTDFIGQIVAPVTNDGGWAGATMGSSMVSTLIIAAWPHDGAVVSSFRKATGYTSPPVVEGNFTMTTIPDGTYVNDTAFSYTFLCSNCIGDDALVLSTTSNVLGWAYATDAPTTPSDSTSALTYHDAGFGEYGLTIDDAKSAEYDTWAALATGGSSSSGNSNTPNGGSANGTTIGNTTATISNSTYDYIICGAGAAGIVVAERLAEDGASVLLLERGGPSLAFTGNNDTLSWNSSVTIYDVPGLDYYQSKAGKPALCTDTADQAGCLLGGGTMVNAMMYVKPQSRDFDDQWPQGWKWNDVSESADRLYERDPGQNYGSMDGLRYNNEAYDVLSEFLATNGWTSTDLIAGDHNARTDVYGYPPWLTSSGLRSGPVRTYLPLAQQQSNFKLIVNTKVIRAVRDGSAITGVETETSTGARVIYNINTGGNVILAAGAMSTPRILFNSGIGPVEQLQTVAAGTTGVILPEEADWIDLPVGTQIKDHVIFTLKFTTSTPLYSPPTTEIISPNQTVVDLFAKGSGILAQSGQRLNFWTSVNTTSGKEMFIQGTCNGPANNTVQMKVYLTHGLTSAGSLGITADGNTEYTKEPWLQTDEDIEAITIFMDRLLEMTRAPNSTLTFLSAGSVTGGSNVTGADLIKEHVTASHFVGTAKMGTEGDSGVVVDTDTKVFGTDNLFVVDASMHPDLPTGNTQAIVLVAAEHAAARILALKGGAATNETAVPTVVPVSSTSVPSSISSATGAIASPLHPTPTRDVLAHSSAASQPSQQPGHYGSNPSWGEGSHDGNGQGKSNGKATSTTFSTRTQTPTPTSTLSKEAVTPVATPQAGQQYGQFGQYGHYVRRNVVGRVPLSPDAMEDEARISQRTRMERASFLDAYNS